MTTRRDHDERASREQDDHDEVDEHDEVTSMTPSSTKTGITTATARSICTCWLDPENAVLMCTQSCTRSASPSGERSDL